MQGKCHKLANADSVRFDGKRALEHHREEVHGEARNDPEKVEIDCKYCDPAVSYKTLNGYRKHLRKVHPEVSPQIKYQYMEVKAQEDDKELIALEIVSFLSGPA
jgi:hypothetical protein